MTSGHLLSAARSPANLDPARAPGRAALSAGPGAPKLKFSVRPSWFRRPSPPLSDRRHERIMERCTR
eukprot:451477-Hanusia_phi.AAC.1